METKAIEIDQALDWLDKKHGILTEQSPAVELWPLTEIRRRFHPKAGAVILPPEVVAAITKGSVKTPCIILPEEASGTRLLYLLFHEYLHHVHPFRGLSELLPSNPGRPSFRFFLYRVYDTLLDVKAIIEWKKYLKSR